MATPFYPTITPETLTPFNAALSLMMKDPGYLDHSSCPYPEPVRQFLHKLATGSGAPVAELADVSLETPEDVLEQLSQLYTTLMGFGKSIKASDASEKIQWAKASTSLLERIVTIRERTLNLKQFSEFQSAVLGLLNEVLEPAQRTDFVDRLGKYIDK